MNAKQLAQDSRFNQDLGFQEAKSVCNGCCNHKIAGCQSAPHIFGILTLNVSVEFDKSALRREIENDPYLRYNWQLAVREYQLGNSAKADTVDMEQLIRMMKYVYTCEEDFYQQLNEKLRHLTVSSISSFPYKNYVKLMISQLKPYANKIVLYRGLKKRFRATHGDLYVAYQFESFSTDRRVALGFLRSGGTLLIIETDKSILILDDSQFKSEKEHLIPPGIGGRIKYDIDGFSYNEVRIEMM